MAETTSTNRTPIVRLILVPSVITLLITLLRITGELRHWSPTLFNSSAGGGGALVGITWLVLVFGVYFALKLASDGNGPTGVGRSIGMAVLGLVVNGIRWIHHGCSASQHSREALHWVTAICRGDSTAV